LFIKKLFVAFLILLFTQLSADVVWQKDFSQALELAKKEQKVLMLFVESKSCRWCKKMKSRTLSNEMVIKRLKPYVSVKVIRDDIDVLRDLPAINGVPTIFFLTVDKRVLEKVVGYFNVEDFLSYIDDVEKKVEIKREK
jgi:thioredoxin-related protein